MGDQDFNVKRVRTRRGPVDRLSADWDDRQIEQRNRVIDAAISAAEALADPLNTLLRSRLPDNLVSDLEALAHGLVGLDPEMRRRAAEALAIYAQRLKERIEADATK